MTNRAAWGVVAVAAIGVATAGGTHAASGQTSSPQLSHGDPRVVGALSVPAGFAMPLHLAADPTKPGVWFWSASLSDARIFFWNGATRALQSWDLGDPQIGRLATGWESGLAVARTGDVWLGVNQTLLHLDPHTGQVDRWAIPTPADSAPTEATLPPMMHGTHNVRSVAVDDHGHVAIGQSAASVISVFDASTQRFSTLALPDIGEPTDVAYLADGTLGVGLTDYVTHDFDTLAVFHADGTHQTVHAPSLTVRQAQDHFVTAEHSIATVTEAGVVTAIPTSNTGALAHGLPIEPMAGGRILAGTVDGLAVVDPKLHTSPHLSLAQMPCRAQHGVIGVCATRALAFTVDTRGNVWFVSTSVTAQVLELPAGSV